MGPRLRNILIVLALGAGLLWRLPVTAGEWQFILCENDSLLHLHRVAQCLESYPVVPSIDRYSQYPGGYRAPWLAAVSALYATYARALSLPADLDRLAAPLSWIPPLLGVLSILLTVRLAAALRLGNEAVVVIGFLAALAAQTCRPFFYGVIDHHLFGHLSLLLMAIGGVTRSFGPWAGGLLLFFSTTPEAPPYVTVFLGLLVLAEAGPRSPDETARPLHAVWFLAPAAACLAAWVIDRSLQSEPPPIAELTWLRLSSLQGLWLGALGLTSLAILRARRRVGPAAVLLAVAAVCGSALVPWLAGDAEAILERIFGTDRLFVGEEASILGAGLETLSPWTLVLVFGAAFAAGKAILSWARPGFAGEPFGWLAIAAPTALGLAEQRHLYLAGSLAMIAAGFALVRSRRFLADRIPLRRPLAATSSAALISVLAVPGFLTENVIDRAAIHGRICDPLPVLTAVTSWLRANAPAEDPAKPATDAAMARWSIGHQIHVLGGTPVIADPLNYPWGFRDALLSVWGSETQEDLFESLRSRGARYFVLVDPIGDLLSVWRARGLPASDLVETIDGQIAYRPGLQRFASFRLYMSGGLHPGFDHFRPRMLSPMAHAFSTDGGGTVSVPKGQIYEVVEGATLEGTVAAGIAEVTVDYLVAYGGRSPSELRHSIPVDDSGTFRFRTALPAPTVETTFRVERGYRFTAENRQSVVDVSPEQVRDGDRIAVRWPDEPRPR